jgi:inner membrane protein
MIFLTHLAFALLISIFWANTFILEIPAYQFVSILLFASIFPDIDIGTSVIGKHFKVINFFLQHRGIVHSVFFMTICAIVISSYKAPEYALPFVIGFISHLILDCMTPSGLHLFWPSKICIRGPFRSASIFDFLLFAGLIAASFLLVNHYSGNVFSGFF